jgi:hypothetical protein
MGRKALKRKLGKRVLSGKLTVDEARARLGRATVQKSAWSTWPAQPRPRPVPRYQGDDQYLRDAFAPIPVPRSASVKKTRKAAAAAGPSPQQLLAKVHADARTFDMVNRLPPLIVKQLGDVDRAVVAEYRRQLDSHARMLA